MRASAISHAMCAPKTASAKRIVHIGIGSNIDPARNLRAAGRLLAARMAVRDISPIYRSRPVGLPGPDFLNLAVAVSWESTLWALKLALDEIETLLGRARPGISREREVTPRTIDLDILLDDLHMGAYGTRPWRVPHPDILVYEHVAVPLAEIGRQLSHPGTGQRLTEIAGSLARGGITRTELKLVGTSS